MGVNNGGKHSVDVTYIAQAEATGLAEIRTHTEVTDIERLKDGRWRVYADHTDDAGVPLQHQVITTDNVIMGAGSINTTRLLLRAKNTGTVPDLPDAWARAGVPTVTASTSGVIPVPGSARCRVARWSTERSCGTT
jgi:cholesterol oxidase